MLRRDVYGFGLTCAEAKELIDKFSDVTHIYLFDTPLDGLDIDGNKVQCRKISELMPERFGWLVEYAYCIIVKPEKVPAWMLSMLVQEQERLIRQGRPVPVVMSAGELQVPASCPPEQQPMNRERKAHIKRKKLRDEQNKKKENPLGALYNVAGITSQSGKPKSIGLMRMLNTLQCPVDRCCKNLEAMKNHDFRAGWYLLDVCTTAADKRLVCIRLAKMERYQIIAAYPTIYVRQDKPLSESGYADDFFQDTGVSLEEAVGQIEQLVESGTPVLGVVREAYEAIKNAFLCCGKNFDYPYIDMAQLAKIPFGYLLETNALNIPQRICGYGEQNDFLDGRLWKEYLLSKYVFQRLSSGYDIHCPADIERKLEA